MVGPGSGSWLPAELGLEAMPQVFLLRHLAAHGVENLRLSPVSQ